MRILTVSNVPLDPTLGSGYVISGYVAGLRARGHEVTVLEPRDYEWGRRLRSAKRLRMLAGYTRAAVRAIDTGAWEVVELWGAEAWRTVRACRARKSRPLLVARSNGLEPHLRDALALAGVDASDEAGWLRRLARGMFDRWQREEAVFRDADALTVVSEFDARYARAHGYQPGDRLLALPNPLPDDWLDLSPRAEPARVIGFFGNFTPVKGADLLRVLLPRLLRDHPAWRVRLVGGNLPAANGWGVELAPRIEVIPFVRAKDQLRDIYRTTAIALVPSIYESFGLVAAEAMACGCAVVAAPTGWAADLTENEVVTVRSRDPADWTAAIAGLLRDDARRRSLASAARARVQTLRWSSALDRLEAFYARLLAARKHQPDAGG